MQPPRRLPSIGEIIADKYRIDRLLAEGPRSAIYAATYLAISRPVALKLLCPEHATDPAAVEHQRREARIAGAVQHCNICEVFDLDTDARGHELLLKPLLRGSSLAARASLAPLALEVITDLALQTLDALHALHAAGIVHQRLSAEHLFITEVGDRKNFVKLLGLGGAAAVDDPAMVAGPIGADLSALCRLLRGLLPASPSAGAEAELATLLERVVAFPAGSSTALALQAEILKAAHQPPKASALSTAAQDERKAEAARVVRRQRNDALRLDDPQAATLVESWRSCFTPLAVARTATIRPPHSSPQASHLGLKLAAAVLVATGCVAFGRTISGMTDAPTRGLQTATLAAPATAIALTTPEQCPVDTTVFVSPEGLVSPEERTLLQGDPIVACRTMGPGERAPLARSPRPAAGLSDAAKQRHTTPRLPREKRSASITQPPRSPRPALRPAYVVGRSNTFVIASFDDN